jgi:fido (protein-threonine AMPylation protein)
MQRDEMTVTTPDVLNFIRESNRIEGIKREPTRGEIEEYHRFMAQDQIQLVDMVHFVSVYQPEAQLRDRLGLNVSVGSYRPPAGDISIKTRLQDIIEAANDLREVTDTGTREAWRVAHGIHVRYQSLHPFTDGNGRSGRMLWMWMMREAPLGFLHTWYYQSLAARSA